MSTPAREGLAQILNGRVVNIPTDPSRTRPARLAPLAKLPIFVDLQGRRVVLIGGREPVVWKAELLAAAGASLDVYAEDFEPDLDALAALVERVRLHRRAWEAADLDGAAFVVADPEDEAEATRIQAAARARGLLLNAIDNPPFCDFQFGTIVNRSPVVIGVMTDGGAPILGQAIRRRIEAVVPVPVAAWSRSAKAFRGRLKALLPGRSDRRAFWERFVDAALTSDLAEADQPAELERLARGVGGGARPGRVGEVVIVGAGPGDPDLLTLKAMRELQAADVIVYDRLVTPGVLELARREARRVHVGKEGHGASCRQDDICALLVDLALAGERVVRLKGGDPSVFGRTGEEVAACDAAGVPVRVVPGVTTASAAAASLALSLTHRDHAQRVQFVTGHDRRGDLPSDLDFRALADPRSTLVVYMGRRTAAQLATRLIAEGLARATPVIAMADVSRPEEKSLALSLGDLAVGATLPERRPVVILIGSAMRVREAAEPALVRAAEAAIGHELSAMHLGRSPKPTHLRDEPPVSKRSVSGLVPRMQESTMFAHSVPGTTSGWEPLVDHSTAVGSRSAAFAAAFGWTEIARLAGCLHDIGKCSPAFQAYIASATDEARSRGPDHSTAGAREAIAMLGGPIGQIVAFAVAGHHAGLADGRDLAVRLAKTIEPYDPWRAHVGPLPARAALAEARRPREGPEGRGFTYAFLTRMLFSCLVDADRLETAGFYARAEGRHADRVEGTPLPVLRDRLRAHMAALSAQAATRARTATAVRLNAARAEILAHALDKAALPPGLFTLTVPTGGGKTLASLAFALAHAAEHDLRRVVYVIPFTSIIEQTAAVFRRALGPAPGVPNDEDVLEHHASFDREAALRGDRAAEDGRGSGPAERLQRATENWDAPIVVTTAVQFFESLFSNRPAACRKLHNLAKSVIVLDEAQTLPLRILRPCLAAIDELARNYGASVVLCTATQPAWRQVDGKLLERLGGRPGRNLGLDIPVTHELAPDPTGLFERLRRVEVDYRPEPIGDDVVADRFAEQPQMLCIVNSRRHAKALFDRIAHLPGAIHLSTWMCPRHRRLVLERARIDLKAGAPVRIVSTSLIEAGVDIDLPEVWRAAAGVDSCLQAAGRCNREFELAAGRLVIFLPAEDRAPHDLRQAWDAGRAVLRRHPDPQTLAAIAEYFGELYANRGSEALDASTLGTGQDRRPYPILRHIRERADDVTFPFASVAEAFRVIEDTMAPVIVPWSSGPGDTEAGDVLRRIRAMDTPLRGDLRRLQHYTVSIPEKQQGAWLAQGALHAVHPALGDAMLCFDDLALYDERSGLRVGEPERRSAESNVIGD